jgi:multiple sugar transport system permease protein
MMPLAKPALITVAIFTFFGTWNDFMGPLLYLHSPQRFTVSIGLATFRGVLRTRWDLLMAASTAMTLPVLIVFFLAQRYFVQGVVLTGLKG